MSAFASPDVQASVLAMRLANAAIAVGFMTAVFFALPRHARPALLVSVLASVVPLGIFILASTNPSSWAVISAATVWICLYGALRTTGSRQVVLCLLTATGAILGAGARADAAAYALFGVGVAFILGARRGRSVLLPSITAGFVGIASVLFFLTAAQGRSVTAGLGIESEPLTMADHISNFLGIPGLWFGVFGSAPLGWLDTSMPYLVPVLAFGAFCAAIAIGIRVVGWRRGAALALAVAAVWVTPFILLAQSDLHVADNLIQPRYILPLLVILLGIAALAPRLQPAGLRRGWWRWAPRCPSRLRCRSTSTSAATQPGLMRPRSILAPMRSGGGRAHRRRGRLDRGVRRVRSRVRLTGDPAVRRRPFRRRTPQRRS